MCDAAGVYQQAICTCFMEQGTRYGLSQTECRKMARYGAPYNPYGKRDLGSSSSPAAAALVAAPAPSATESHVAGTVVEKGCGSRAHSQNPQATATRLIRRQLRSKCNMAAQGLLAYQGDQHR